MDRWDDGDDLEGKVKGPQGQIARLGMGGFVKADSSMGSSEAAVTAKASVMPSRRDQRKQQDVKLMPPPPSLAPPAPAAAPAAQPPQPQASTSGYTPPAWAGQPPRGTSLQVLKDGVPVQDIPLLLPATVFGRHASADVVLDHPSVSRHHAAICYQSLTGRWMVLDLGSVHKTFVDNQPLEKGTPVELRSGRILRFAASTRQYRLGKSGSLATPSGTLAQSAPASDGFAAPPPPKRQRSDPTAAGPSGASSQDGSLGSLAGYSGGPNSPGGAAPGPGSHPQQPSSQRGTSASDPAEGRFAQAVKYGYMTEDQGGGNDAEGADGHAKTPTAGPAKSGVLKSSHQSRAKAGAEQQRRPSWLLTQQPKAKSTSLYGTLPPPTSSSTLV
ncbi:hypothetical protein WJX74_007760 [Apatococcus lobatus]|uniref:FHA domain-containing protein n=2 Tax=Apatococcus TaxID=904362 RepID=A0AAW1SPB7_9CHLO